MREITCFGTGYSSLAYLKKFVVDKLKIDRSFIGDIGRDTCNAAIIQTIVQLGHTLKLSIVAEGVETDGQLEFLKESGCNEGQGFLFCHPVPAEQFIDALCALGALDVGVASEER